MHINNNLSTLTLAAGDSLFNEDSEQKFFFNSLIVYKKNIFEDLGIKQNYFLVSNEKIYKEKRIKNLIYNNKLINYGSLGSLMYFLNTIKKIPDFLLVNYVDKKISHKDLKELLEDKYSFNIISASQSQKTSKATTELFNLNQKNYLFNGFIILTKDTLIEIKNLDKQYQHYNLTYLFNLDSFKKSKYKILENKNKVIEVRKKIDVAKLLLGSKSKSLHNLKEIKTAKIPYFEVLNKSEINDLDNKLKNFKSKIIIRSDSDFEDSFEESNAGKFLSIGPIDKKNKSTVKKSVNSVFNSYPVINSDGRVIIQNFVPNIKSSGVITTRVLQNSAPYFCISLAYSHNSDEVTAGTSNKLKNIYIYKNVKKLEGKYKKYQNLLNLINELIDYISYELLDIEFAIDESEQVFLLQVRPLLVDTDTKDNKIEMIKNIRQFQQLQNKGENIYGSRALFSNMSDWNPAEMLGESPNNLAITLYKTFITNDSWHKQRKEFGYRGEIESELMFYFGNKCYIDVRASLNSFLPKSLTKEDCEKIIDYQLNALLKHPEFHDKIEFEIAETSYFFGSENRMKKRYKNLLNQEVIIDWVNDLKSLEKDYLKILNNSTNKITKFYQKLSPNLNFASKNTVNSIKRNMAVPFSHHARLAFIYFSQLNHFVNNDVILEDEKQILLNNLNTISTQFTEDLKNLKYKKISYTKFISKYGHIRPNNYDLNSKNIHDEGEDFVFFLIENLEDEKTRTVDSSKALKKIEYYLNKENYEFNANEWHHLFEKSIISRENSKFMYSKSIDLTLNQLKNSKLYDQDNLKNLNFENLINNYKITYEEPDENFELPDLLTTSNEFLYFANLNTKPNFIGQKIVKGNLTTISKDKSFNYRNKIILLPNADPGWDWVLNLPIKGMVTKFGGPNSHMAIRAAEKNLTSVFGVGDELFKQLEEINYLQIDPISKQLYLN